jgi:hypothetical protein
VGDVRSGAAPQDMSQEKSKLVSAVQDERLEAVERA